MLKRKFYDTLVNWKKTKKHECLTVTGARQVGKTYIIEKFGQENYDSYIYINFLKNPELKSIFSDTLEPEAIYKRISLQIPAARFVEKDTLIFLDEIQACRRARTALKFLALDDRYDVISSGSLLGLNYNAWDDEGFENEEEYSVPVGYEREIDMYSLDFEEYLWANGYGDNAVDILAEYFLRREKVDHEVNRRYLELFNEYMVIGGMPEVVQEFVNHSNYNMAFEIQQKILREYMRDINHYAKNSDKPKIRKCYESMPRQLARENRRFTYGVVESGGKARKYGNAIEWLLDAGLVRRISNVSIPVMPLAAYEKTEEFKLYLSDIGLLTAMFGVETQRALLEKKLTGPAKGGIYENLVFDILMKKNKKVYYYRRANSEQEIEFLLEDEGEVVPVEVKSKNGETLSLNTFMQEYSPQKAYKLIDGNVGVRDGKVTVPLYMAMFI